MTQALSFEVGRPAAPSRCEPVRLTRLRIALQRIERLSCDGAADVPAARSIWEGLLAGRWSPFDRFETADRAFAVVRRNDAESCATRALSPREREIAESLGCGRSEKEISYDLGISPAVVSRGATSAREKLGLTTRAELAGFFAANGICRRMVELDLDSERFAVGSIARECVRAVTGLSSSEVFVARAASRGTPSAAIAAERGTSRRTVENQLGAIYRKLGVHSAAELAVRLTP